MTREFNILKICRRTVGAIVVLWGLIALAGCVFSGLAIWVLAHFIGKVW